MQLDGRQFADWLEVLLSLQLELGRAGHWRYKEGDSGADGDNLRGEVLLKALGWYPDRTARPVWT